MKNKDLIEFLMKHDPEIEITILDGFNGGGCPRSINFNTKFEGVAAFDGDEMADYSDLDTKEGNPIIVLGYGCY